jgi:hypothetical protein
VLQCVLGSDSLGAASQFRLRIIRLPGRRQARQDLAKQVQGTEARAECFARMIEPIMYVSMGFLFACLIGLAVMPLIHDRAVRLTMRRLEGTLPLSMAEIQAEKDLLRAEFALSSRRLENKIEQLAGKKAGLQLQLGKKSDIINTRTAERDALKTEMVGLKMQVERLKKQLPEVATTLDPSAYVVRQMSPRRILRPTKR